MLPIQENVALAPFTTLGIGGPARYFIRAVTENTAQRAVSIAVDLGVPLFVLGGGSNLLVSDEGFKGLVLKVAIRGIEWQETGDRMRVCVGAGEDWDRVVAMCVERRLAGIECLSGIPGSAGGTPVQNAGAYGQEVSDVLASVRAYDRQAGRMTELSREDCGFAYRTSIFNTTAKDRYIVLSVSYLLVKNGAPAVRYADLQCAFEGYPCPPLAEVREAVRRIRAAKAMLLVDGDPDCRSAGSFFKNPVLTDAQFASLESSMPGERPPRYPAGPGRVKIAAAWLIERAGFHKGYALGPAGLSTKHTLALVNKGGASAEDLLRLARRIRKSVFDRFGIGLVPEPVFLGFSSEIVAEFFGEAPQA